MGTAISAQGSGGGKQTQRRAQASIKDLRAASGQERTTFQPARQSLAKLLNQVLTDPGAALNRLNPLSQLARDEIGLGATQSRNALLGQLEQSGLTNTALGASLLSRLDQTARLDQRRAALAPILQMFGNAGQLSQIGLDAGLQGAGIGAQAFASLTGSAMQGDTRGSLGAGGLGI